ncbi:hypothetical protein, partial [Pseudomonas fragi]|uniref:hypothetical protein n=2 Tax=Pseudomonas TaxID=286 RepID=UPI0028E8FB51
RAGSLPQLQCSCSCRGTKTAFGGEAVVNPMIAIRRRTAPADFTTASPPNAASLLRQLLRDIEPLNFLPAIKKPALFQAGLFEALNNQRSVGP